MKIEITTKNETFFEDLNQIEEHWTQPSIKRTIKLFFKRYGIRVVEGKQ